MDDEQNNDLIARARAFASEAHQRIDQRRKYSGQPYATHLKAVADVVAGVTDSPAAVAAAWLHDIVEDTPATIEDIAGGFGAEVAQLVNALTDVSRPSDGNRKQRKAIDREHLASASPLAKTIKLADLIDNCADICRHDPRFGRVFLDELALLLPVLREGEPRLLRRAEKLLATWQKTFSKQGLAHADPDAGGNSLGPYQQRALEHLYRRFLAADLGNPHGRPSHPSASQIVCPEASLIDVVKILTRRRQCLIKNEDGWLKIVREDFSSPIARMWLFGIITSIELDMKWHIQNLADGEWPTALSPERLAHAQALQQERHRRKQTCDLMDCLQLADLLTILLEIKGFLSQSGFQSKNAVKRVFNDLEMLRNYLAHSQPIGHESWTSIARLARHIDAHKPIAGVNYGRN